MIREPKINWKRLAKDIGGKYLLDRKSLALMTPFLIVISVLSSSSTTTDPQLLSASPILRYVGLLVANVLSISLCWAYLELVDRTLFRNKHKKPISLVFVLAFGASIGFLKGYSTGLFSWLLGSELDLDQAISNRIVQTTVLGLWTIPLLALVTATFARYQAERQMLLSELVEQALKGPLDPLSSRVTEDLMGFIKLSKAEISQMRVDSSGAVGNLAIAKNVRELVETGLRPISHRIWEREEKSEGGFSFKQIFFLALRSRPSPLWIIAVGLGIGLAPINLVAYPIPDALVRTLLTVLFVVSIFFFAGLLPAVSPAKVFTRFFISNALASVAAPVLTDFVVAREIDWSQYPAWIAMFLWMVQLSLFASVASEVLVSRARVREQLVELVGESGLRSEVRMTISKLNNRELAQYVHGNLQNKLLSLALKLEHQDLSPHQVSNLLNELEAILDGALDNYRSHSDKSLELQLQEITQRWAGFVNVSVSLSVNSLASSEANQRTIVQVVSEAVSNSVRHGLAKNLVVDINEIDTVETNFIQITVKDDGLGPRSGAPGLGAELFAAASAGNWSVSQIPTGGSLLTLKIQP